MAHHQTLILTPLSTGLLTRYYDAQVTLIPAGGDHRPGGI
jgi:hypothetical protein